MSGHSRNLSSHLQENSFRSGVYNSLKQKFLGFNNGNLSRTKVQEYLERRNKEQPFVYPFAQEKDLLALRILCQLLYDEMEALMKRLEQHLPNTPCFSNLQPLEKQKLLRRVEDLESEVQLLEKQLARKKAVIENHVKGKSTVGDCESISSLLSDVGSFLTDIEKMNEKDKKSSSKSQIPNIKLIKLAVDDLGSRISSTLQALSNRKHQEEEDEINIRSISKPIEPFEIHYKDSHEIIPTNFNPESGSNHSVANKNKDFFSKFSSNEGSKIFTSSYIESHPQVLAVAAPTFSIKDRSDRNERLLSLDRSDRPNSLDHHHHTNPLTSLSTGPILTKSEELNSPNLSDLEPSLTAAIDFYCRDERKELMDLGVMARIRRVIETGMKEYESMRDRLHDECSEVKNALVTLREQYRKLAVKASDYLEVLTNLGEGNAGVAAIFPSFWQSQTNLVNHARADIRKILLEVDYFELVDKS